MVPLAGAKLTAGAGSTMEGAPAAIEPDTSASATCGAADGACVAAALALRAPGVGAMETVAWLGGCTCAAPTTKLPCPAAGFAMGVATTGPDSAIDPRPVVAIFARTQAPTDCGPLPAQSRRAGAARIAETATAVATATPMLSDKDAVARATPTTPDTTPFAAALGPEEPRRQGLSFSRA